MKHVLFAVIFSVVLTGCANFTSPARKHNLDSSANAIWMDYDASRRGTLLLKKGEDGSEWVTCSEPAPDVALNFVNKLEGNLKAKDLEIADAKGEVTINAIKLAERTQMVSFLRESLFRLCEMSLNHNFDDVNSKEMYMGVLNAALALVEKDKQEIESEKLKAQAEVEKAKAFSVFIEKGNSPEKFKF
ncbi:hypothetical protein [Vibrio furnissii]|uniref:hypothetical protein n=1 Tax=Vibrio furnissii TaxID=29494 RepID=UPI0015593E11|nr:hypothetical protein [Vibrio furnissii]